MVLSGRRELRREGNWGDWVAWDTYFPPADVGGRYCAIGLCSVIALLVVPIFLGRLVLVLILPDET